MAEREPFTWRTANVDGRMSGRVKRAHHAKHGARRGKNGKKGSGTKRVEGATCPGPSPGLLLTHIHSSMIIALIIILLAAPGAAGLAWSAVGARLCVNFKRNVSYFCVRPSIPVVLRTRRGVSRRRRRRRVQGLTRGLTPCRTHA